MKIIENEVVICGMCGTAFVGKGNCPKCKSDRIIDLFDGLKHGLEKWVREEIQKEKKELII